VYLVSLAVSAPTPDPKNTPNAALAAARADGPRGKVLNDYDFGGFLIYAGVPTFADGRSDLYGDEFLRPYFMFLHTPSDEGLRTLADKFDIEWTLFRADSAAAKFMDTRPDWTRVYKDDVAAVHRRATPTRP
jgi:hypothetical protein